MQTPMMGNSKKREDRQEQAVPKASSKQCALTIDNGHDDDFDDV